MIAAATASRRRPARKAAGRQVVDWPAVRPAGFVKTPIDRHAISRSNEIAPLVADLDLAG